jgi:hypothetical protein
VKKSTQTKKKPNKQDNARNEKSTQILKKPNKNIYDHNPNRHISPAEHKWGINE